MIAYLNCTANLGDFLNAMPVIAGIVNSYGKMDLTIKKEMRKFKGIKDFLLYQDLFTSVSFDDEVILHGNILLLSSWTREDKNNPIRPTETCRYENFVKDNYRLEFDVNDSFVLNCPELNIEINNNTYWVGDRWGVGDIDDRRESNILSHLKTCCFIDYEETLLHNASIIKNLKRPFISNFTGVGIMADLLNVEQYIVWKAEDWKPEYRVGNDVSWDNGKNIQQVFEKHFYLDRKSKLVHSSELEDLL